jgi:DNA-binding NarL/FixJ family response regulator
MARRKRMETTEIWRQLEAGSWTIRAEPDRLHLLAREHPEPLTARERVVVELASRGWSNKVIAYELGVGASTVSTHMSRAIAKLGVASRASLIQVVLALASRPGAVVTLSGPNAEVAMPSVPAMPAQLTRAQRDVVARVFAGATNAAIARERGVSTRTVENQLAAAMKRLGVTSRASLIAALMRRAR